MGSDYKSLGYAHIEFVSSEYVVEAIKAHEVAPLEIEGRAVRFDYERPKRPAPPQPSPRAVESDYEPSPTLFVGNLPFGATTKDIFQVLNPLGKVVDIRLGLLHHRTGRLNRILNLGSYSAHLERGVKRIRTHRLREYR